MHVPQIRSGLVLGAIAAALISATGTPGHRGTLNAVDGAGIQQDQQVPESQRPLKVQTALVNLFVTVRDKDHAILTNLKQEDFRIFEDNVEQKVAFFSKEVNLPITLAILVDTSGSQQHLLLAEQDTASRFVHEVLHKNDEAMVMSFDTDVDLLADFTEDTSILERAIRKTVINVDAAGAGGTAGTVPSGSGGGGTAFYDAIYLAAHDKLTSEAGRKAIIALTDAEDNDSKLSLQDAAESAQRADAVVHILLLAEPEEYFRAGMGYGGADAAKRLADDTGGRVIAVRSEKSLEKAFDELTQELRSQYVLGYYPTNTKHDGNFRKIKVEVARPDARVLTRRGYYAPTD
jgi:VWFA-related protein